MNIESVKSLFELFSGEPQENYLPLAELAVAEVEKMLIPDADSSDVRLNFLAAAIANYRLSQIKNSQDRTKVTCAGKMLDPAAAKTYAAGLLRDYLQLCSPLIRPRTFIFTGFCGGEEIC